MKKLFILLLIINMIIIGCSSVNRIKDTNSLYQTLFHEVYNNKLEAKDISNIKVLSIYNTLGNIHIAKSNDNNLRITVKMAQTKNIRDLDKKLESILIIPEYKNNIMLLEPLYSKVNHQNYWQWINEKSNANGIHLDFFVLVPSTVKELRLYGELGDINLENITAKIHAQTNIGNITGKSINPLDDTTFLTYINDKKGIDIGFTTTNNANKITVITNIGDINLRIPNGEKIDYIQVDNKENYNYIYEMFSQNQFLYCKNKCLQKYTPINKTVKKTTIITNTDSILGKINISNHN